MFFWVGVYRIGVRGLFFYFNKVLLFYYGIIIINVNIGAAPPPRPSEKLTLPRVPPVLMHH